MRFVMFQHDQESRLGVLIGAQILDLTALASESAPGPIPTTLLQLIDQGADGLELVRSELARWERGGSDVRYTHPLSDTMLRSPMVPTRADVIAIGRNYAEHAAESARARGEAIERPTVFTKAQTSMSGPYDDIPLHPDITSEVDWEVELAVVIGRRGTNVAREDALDHVFGYTVVNDISARDIQFAWGGQYFKGKSLDGFCPCGPCVVTADEIQDPQNLRLQLRVNGETMQDANTGDMILPVDELIVQLSLGMTLVPGTLIATGTPAGVGFGRTPPVFLKAGDLVEAEVEGIGTLRNSVIL